MHPCRLWQVAVGQYDANQEEAGQLVFGVISGCCEQARQGEDLDADFGSQYGLNQQFAQQSARSCDISAHAIS